MFEHKFYGDTVLISEVFSGRRIVDYNFIFPGVVTAGIYRDGSEVNVTYDSPSDKAERGVIINFKDRLSMERVIPLRPSKT